MMENAGIPDINSVEDFLKMEKDEVDKVENEEEIVNENSEKEEWMDILGNGQLKKKILKNGEPDTRPTNGNICTITYVGKLSDGTEIERGEKVEIYLGDYETVQGLDFALALMDKGEEAELIVSPRFGYGSLGLKPSVPPDSTLNYNLILHDVQIEEPITNYDLDKRHKIGLRKKERGNFWYTRGDYTLAIHLYRSALEYLDDEGESLLEDRLKTYNNLGAAQMKINAYDAALTSVENVLAVQPDNVKALFRKASIFKSKNDIEQSIAVVRRGLQIDPNNKPFQQELSSLLATQRVNNTKQKDLYKKMMGNKPNNEKKPKTTKFGAYTIIAAVSVAVAAIGAIVVRYKVS